MHIKYKVVSAGNDESHIYEVYNGKLTHVFTGTNKEVKDWLDDKKSHLSQSELLDYFKDLKG